MAAAPAYAHPSAIIDAGAHIGDGSKVWHFAHVCSGAKIGQNCVLGQNTYISGKSSVGDLCKIQNNVAVYDGVHLGDNVFVGPSAVFTNDLYPRAVPFGGHWSVSDTHVKEGASIGANATIVCGTTIGAYSLVGAGSTVTKDVKPYSLVVGNPAKHVGWMSAAGFRLNLPPSSPRPLEAQCARSGERYVLDGETLTRVQ